MPHVPKNATSVFFFVKLMVIFNRGNQTKNTPKHYASKKLKTLQNKNKKLPNS
jgi:hypothetical protein